MFNFKSDQCSNHFDIHNLKLEQEDVDKSQDTFHDLHIGHFIAVEHLGDWYPGENINFYIKPTCDIHI